MDAISGRAAGALAGYAGAAHSKCRALNPEAAAWQGSLAGRKSTPRFLRGPGMPWAGPGATLSEPKVRVRTIQ